MKISKLLLGFPAFYCIILIVSSHSAGCSKTTTVHDTTKVIVKDTVTQIKTDTLLVKDSSCNLKCGLIAYFNFNAGNLNDSSGFNNNITFNSATKTNDRFGKANNAYLFNGTSSYMTVKNNSSLNPSAITMFAIVKVNDFYLGPCGGNQILSKGYPYDVNGFYDMSYFDFASNCGTINVNNESFGGGYGNDIPLGANAGVGSDSVIIQKGQWYKVAYTYDGKTAKFYVNGLLKDSLNKIVPFTANTNDIYIGKHENPAFPYYLNGVIDELRLYNRALPPAAVLLLNSVQE